MSLIRLLSYVPFARRLGSAMDSRVTSSAWMISLSLHLLAAVWGLMLLVSAAVLAVIAWHTSDVTFFSSPDARDAEIQSIKSVTDVGLLQNKAVLDVAQGSDSSATATYLCHLALGTLLVIIIGSIGGLLLVLWMKRHLRTVEDEL